MDLVPSEARHEIHRDNLMDLVARESSGKLTILAIASKPCHKKHISTWFTMRLAP